MNTTHRVWLALVCAVLLPCGLYGASTNLTLEGLWRQAWGADLLPGLTPEALWDDLFNMAEQHVQQHRVKQYSGPFIYEEMAACLPSNALDGVMWDECPAAFLLEAGLCYVRGAASGENTPQRRQARAHGLRAAAIAESFGGLIGARRLAFLYQDLAHAGADQAERDAFTLRAIEVFPAHNLLLSRMAAYYAWRLHQRGKHAEAAAMYDALFAKNPFTFHYIFAQAGRMRANREDYRAAFGIWLRGLRDMNPAPFNSCAQDIIREIMEFLPYATQAELQGFDTAVRYQAARKAAILANVADIAQWLQFVHDPRIAAEARMRAAEARGDADVTNLWRAALAATRHPEYARKLGDYVTLAELYCEHMQREELPFVYSTMTPCAAERLHALFTGGKMDRERIRLYRDTLKARADKFRASPQPANQERVRQLDARAARIEQSNPWLLDAAQTEE